jgi:hypothetical protein
LVNAAGRELFRRFLDISFEDWKKIVEIISGQIVGVNGGRNT